MKTRRRYDAQFKEDAVALVESSNKTLKEIADELGLEPSTLGFWRRAKIKHGEKAFPGNGNPRDEEISRLKRELSETRMERDILKKALGIFSKPHQP
jgi:transposase